MGGTRGSDSGPDWAAVVERVGDGDEAAFLELSRLITGFLRSWRAGDFGNGWDDLIQEVVLAASQAVQSSQLQSRGAARSFIYSTTRNKFMDRLRARYRRSEAHSLPWDEAVADNAPQTTAAAEPTELRHDLREALDSLPELNRDLVCLVYVDGMTYQEAADKTGTPLGSAKRYLRDGLAQLRGILG